jgi:DNA-binding GntR family transcriptional regulator
MLVLRIFVFILPLALLQEGTFTTEEKEGFAWFDGLGFPDVRNAKYVRVATGWGSESENRYIHAWLLEDPGKEFKVLMPDLEVRTFAKTGPEKKEHERVGYEAVDLEKAVRAQLDALIALSKSEEQDVGRRFGEMLEERSELFALARSCAHHGKAKLARDLLEFAQAMPDLETGKPPEKALRQVVADEIAHTTMWRGIVAFEDVRLSRKELLARFRRFGKDFPGSPHGERAKETADLLERMVAEDEARAKQAPRDQAADLIFQLRDQNGSQMSQPGACDIFLDERGEKSPAHRLVAMGYDAVPLLIEAIEDVRFTRSVGNERDFYFSHHVLRVGDCALAILERIAGRSFYQSTEANAAMVKDGAAAATKEKLKAWWAEFQKKGEKQMLVEAVEAGDPEQASRLCRRYPDAALPALEKGIGNAKSARDRMALVGTVGELESKEATDFLLRELREGPSLHSRTVAAGLLWRRGRRDGVATMIEEWKKLKPDAEGKGTEGLVEFLARCGQAEAVRALGDGLARRPVDHKLAVISAFGVTGAPLLGLPPGPGEPKPVAEKAVLDAVEELLVSALDDTDERDGVSGSWMGKSFKDPRMGDVAGHVLSMRFEKKYAFDLSAFASARDRQRVECKNVWRKERGLPLVRLPERRPVTRLPDEELRPLLDRAAGAELEAKGLGALPAVVGRLESLGADDPARKALSEVASRLACTVSELTTNREVAAPELSALDGRPFDAKALLATVLRLAGKLPPGTRGFKLVAERDADLTGVQLRVDFVSRAAPQGGTPKGWSTTESVTVGKESVYGSLGSSTYEHGLKEEGRRNFLKAAAKAFAAPPRERFEVRISLVQEE